MATRRRVAGKQLDNSLPHYKHDNEYEKSPIGPAAPKTFPTNKLLKWIAITASVSVLFILASPALFGGRRLWASYLTKYVLWKQNCNNGAPHPSQSNIILVASHLRHGSEGELRLRNIEHNLRLLAKTNDNTKPLKSIVIFSTDESSSEESIRDMVDKWRHWAPTMQIDDVLFVKNDSVLVDASKWMVALYQLLPEIERTNARVLLLNDSFLLTRTVPELWKDSCGGVCGLVWTADSSDFRRHIQSYIRSLSSCEVYRYMSFYEENKGRFRDVNDLIQHFEIKLGWAENVSALFDYVGSHPDSEEAQKLLLPRAYPAIKLKKFFVTDDPWLSESEVSRSRLPPAFSAGIYRKLNHDLTFLNQTGLEDHFATLGKNEDRIYSPLPLVVKGWITEELHKLDDGESTIHIFQDYLLALNAHVAELNSEIAHDFQRDVPADAGWKVWRKFWR